MPTAPDLAPHAPALRRLGLLASLYFAQGLPYGFFTQALPAWLRQQGLSLEHIGLASLLALPWGLKFLWAPLVDRYGSQRLGHRRAWILPLQALTVLALLAAALYQPSLAHLPPLMALVLLTNLLAATQDVATDALAVDLLPPQERGLGNGLQVGAYRLGMIVGGGALLVAFAKLGWTPTFGLMAALLALASVPILLYREPPKPAPAPLTSAPQGSAHAPDRAHNPALDAARRLADALRHLWRASPLLLPWPLFLLLYKAGEHMASAMLKPMLIDLKYSLADIGALAGTLGSLCGLLGALGGGWLTSRLSTRKALPLLGLLQALGIASWALAPLLPSYPWVAAFTAAEHLSSGAATAALFTAAMERCRPEHAATDYTAQASLIVLGTGVAAALSGYPAQALGYPAHFALCAALALLPAALASFARDPRP